MFIGRTCSIILISVILTPRVCCVSWRMSCRTLRTTGTEVCLSPPSYIFWLFPPVWIMGHVPSGWDGSDALEAPSNLCRRNAFIKRCLTSWHLLYSLPDVSGFQADISSSGLFSDFSVDRFSPHVIASEFLATGDNIKLLIVPQISSLAILMKTSSRSVPRSFWVYFPIC